MKKLYLLILLLIYPGITETQSWTLVWSDEFSNAEIDPFNWTYDIGGSGWGNNELQYYTNSAANSKTENGKLLIIVKKETYGGRDYTSARLKTKGLQFFTYGKIEASIKLPAGKGIWPAFWMMGNNISQVGWPRCGEIDIMEHINTEQLIYGSMHWDYGGHVNYTGVTSCNVTSYHIYSVEWDANAIKWYLDGNKYWEGNISNHINGTEEFHLPFFILLNMAIGGNWAGNPDGTTTFPDTMYVDYVRVYQKLTNINIPDTAFLYALIDEGVDTNGDSLISYAEAEAIKKLDVEGKSISDMKGIEAFIHLDTLSCSFNQLTSLDVTNNTALTVLACAFNGLTSLDVSNNTALLYLDCNANQLTSLDVSNNIALTILTCGDNQLTSLDISHNTTLIELRCEQNQLTSLDVSKNTALTWLECDNNSLTSLDVSHNTALEELSCRNNQLTSLDVSHNTALEELNIAEIPTLYEVCVWIMPFPPASVYVRTDGSPNLYFSYCPVTALNAYNEENKINIYPNPSDDIINIEIENINNAIIEIYNVSGTLIFSKVIHSESEKVDISGFSKGVYLVKVKQDSIVTVGKVVVR